MRNILLAMSALLMVLIVRDAHAVLDILGYDGGAPGTGQDFRDENDSKWFWEDGLFGDAGPEGDVFSNDADYPGWICPPCRDPETHPIDFTAMAYNAYFGENPWAIDSILGIPFRVYNLQLDWVVIWFDDVVLDLPSTLPDTMTVLVRLPTGQIKEFEVLQGGPDLPIGDPDAESDGSSGGWGGDDSDGSDDDDYGEDDGDVEEPEIDEPEGEVEIEDPDDDGEFPEWEEEL